MFFLYLNEAFLEMTMSWVRVFVRARARRDLHSRGGRIPLRPMRAFRALVSLALLPGLAEAQGAPGHAAHDLKRAHNSRPHVHRRSIRTEPLAGRCKWAAQ